MSVSTHFENHLPETLYTTLNERELLDNEEHAFETESYQGTLKIFCDEEGKTKEHVLIHISFEKHPEKFQAFYHGFQEKFWFISAVIDAQGRDFIGGSKECCPITGFTKIQLTLMTPPIVKDVDELVKQLFAVVQISEAI
ncbi:MAG: hypothetical protein K940chlam8_01270 [Chlamydiae bacterium]|nr:hypothetical protein [Chlamydiota bacterium]